jgi:hypothetical protein
MKHLVIAYTGKDVLNEAKIHGQENPKDKETFVYDKYSFSNNTTEIMAIPTLSSAQQDRAGISSVILCMKVFICGSKGFTLNGTLCTRYLINP